MTEVFESCGLGLFEAIGIKSVIIGSSMSILEATSSSVGAPLFPSFTPGNYYSFFFFHTILTVQLSGSFAQGTDSMSFLERLENIIHMAISYDFSASLGGAQHQLFVKRYGQNFPSMEVIHPFLCLEEIYFRSLCRELSLSLQTPFLIWTILV